MKSLNEIDVHRKTLSDAFGLSDPERKAAKMQASKVFEKICQEYTELSAPEKSSIRKQLNQELVSFLITARHMESMDLKGRDKSDLETSSPSTAEAGMSLSNPGVGLPWNFVICSRMLRQAWILSLNLSITVNCVGSS